MTPQLLKKVDIAVIECRGQGISPQVVLEGFKKMKADLEALGCEVSIRVDGLPIEAFSVVDLPEGAWDE